nr:AsmA-like C-terminal region-containing protein [Agrobacterium vitis]
MGSKRKWSASRRWRGRRLARTVIVIAVAMLCIFVASRLAAPYIVSSSLVRGSIEKAISRWSGHDVEIAGTPSLQFWPEPRITLPDVTITAHEPGISPSSGKSADANGAKKRVLAHIDVLSASFGLIKAAMGNPAFDDFYLVRPHISMRRDARGHLDWAGKGLLSDAINHAQENAGGGQTLDKNYDARIGSITVENGRIDIEDQSLRRTVVIDSIFSHLFWPVMSAPVDGTANMMIGGVATRLDFSSRQPLLLLGGGIAQAEFSLTAPALKGTFKGKTGLAPARFASGDLSLAISDVPGLLAWTGATLPGTEALHTVSVQATVTAEADKIRLDSLSFTANDTSATGLMEMAQAKSGKPKLSGTLAFEQMDIPTVLGAFSLSAPDADTTEGKSGLLDWLEFDLTLSARKATYAPFTLSDLGASILATDGTAVFDIADSTLADGTLVAHLEGKNRNFDEGGHLDLALTNADLSDIESKLALNGPLPLGPGTLTLSATTNRALWETRPDDVTGTLDMTAGPGRITGVNPDGVRQKAAEQRFFRLQDAGKGELPFDSLTLSATLGNGGINIGKGELQGSVHSTSFTGVVPYGFKGLALSAEVRPGTSYVGAFAPLQLFIGGSWPDLIVSPASSPAGSSASSPANPVANP